MIKDSFDHFKSVIRSLPVLSQRQPLPEILRLATERRISVYYAPFDYVNPAAKIVIVGITPGLVQAVKALNKAHELLQKTNDSAVVLQGVNFLGDKPKERLSTKTDPVAIDQNKSALLRMIG